MGKMARAARSGITGASTKASQVRRPSGGAPTGLAATARASSTSPKGPVGGGGGGGGSGAGSFGVKAGVPTAMGRDGIASGQDQTEAPSTGESASAPEQGQAEAPGTTSGQF